MEKILVTTDLSANSKAGIRFAAQLAHLRNAELVVLHVHYVLRASLWTEQEYAGYIRHTRENIMEELIPFVKKIYRYMKIPAGNYHLAVHHHMDTVAGIMEYAAANGCAYIVTSTRGAGTFTKILGTHTSALIEKSAIPVLCIPSSYRVKPITHVLYASDIADYENELKKVISFARPMNTAVEMLHLNYTYELLPDKELMEQTLEKKLGYKVSVWYRKRATESTMEDDLEAAVAMFKPSLLILFTQQGRSFFEKLFLPGNARTYSFHAKVPLLTFKRK